MGQIAAVFRKSLTMNGAGEGNRNLVSDDCHSKKGNIAHEIHCHADFGPNYRLLLNIGQRMYPFSERKSQVFR